MTRWQLGPGWLARSVHAIIQAKRWHWLILVTWMVPLLLAGFFDLDHQSLMAHDEGLYARRARVIVDSGDWVHPWAAPHHKTPGPYWVVGLFITLLGRHEVAVRLPSVLASIGCLLLTYAIGRRLLTPKAALLGALSLGVAPLWLQYSRLATPDVLFTGLILLAIWLLLTADRPEHNASNNLTHRHWFYFGAGITLGITVLVRSALAAIPIACLLPYLLLSGRHHLKQWSLYLGGLVGLLPTAVWLWLCWQRYGMAMINSLINFPVSQGLTADRAKSPLFYLFNLLVNDFLWSFFALGAVILLVISLIKAKTRLSHPQISLLLIYPLSYLGLLSFASTKLPHYAIPTYPFLALLAGYAMEKLVKTIPTHPIKGLLHAINGLLMLLGGLLTVAACLALTTNLLPNTDDISPYAPIALGLGPAWFGAGLLWFNYDAPKPKLLINWLALLLLGQWLSLVIAWGTADLGNINPHMKALLIRNDIQPILQTKAIDFSPGLNSKRSTLLRFYTPKLGEKLNTLEQVSPGDYLWIEDSELSNLKQPYESLGQIKQTHLVRIDF
ncbi:ArnT family glycosyltransferase [Leptothoe spongobia]|uniref:Glycosyltransferase family 39 protein n=1 Tax=Leptothoe spongobia TAU-MAC 1115 TaxID=1967444 RepID=A0A947DDX6_9CYAN|nr:glycosyltransferase family 39 protein [Leptothoe spongobia]MBT9315263.1 glycosyltransferase family 39 protein [Leptothoe spongobia TAU-MAC 1115]